MSNSLDHQGAAASRRTPIPRW